MIEVCQKAQRVLIIDHHTTTCDVIYETGHINNLSSVISLSCSAAQIAWDWIHNMFGTNNPNRPWYIEYIADRDLWKWELPDSKAIGTAMFYNDMYRWEEFDRIDKMSSDETEKFRESLKNQGRLVLKIDERNIKHGCASAQLCKFKEFTVKLVTAFPHLRSEIGNVLSQEGCDFAACANYNFKRDEWNVSLRASKDSSIDLGQICKCFGGGGHPKSAKFIIYGKSSKYGDAQNTSSLLVGTLRDHFQLMEKV